MKLRVFARSLCLSSLLVLAVFGSAGRAQPGEKNPTSKVFVAEVTGESHIDDGKTLQALVKNGVHPAEGATFETKANSTDALVLSNGTALYLAPETRFKVRTFLQEPFAPNRTDMDVEPSVSQTVIQLERGRLGICTSKLVAGSSMVFETSHGTVQVRGRRLLIEIVGDETRISLLEGDVTVIGGSAGTGEILQPGQQAVLRAGASGRTAAVAVQSIPEASAVKIDEDISLACIARRTVFFQSVDGGNELVPVRTTPAAPPTQFTVSPSRIDT